MILSADKTLDFEAMRLALKFTIANRSVQTLAPLVETSIGCVADDR